MDSDRPPHFRTTSTGSSSAAAAATSELLICFSSRLSSSSSMKLNKSILSPGRAARDGGGPISLSSSLSRRLRTNGSIKGGQASPFFATTGKKRGCAFDNPEPSSPKVTCIGQVRVKTKKKVKQQNRSLSRRRSGEVSFRKTDQSSGVDGANQSEDKVVGPHPHHQQQHRYSNATSHYQECLPQHQQQQQQQHRNQRWVHLPISICEALKAFGAEFSCLFPCRSSCFSASDREKEEKQNGSDRNHNGCGAVFARWLVSVNDGEGGRRREIELVVGGGDEEEEMAEERISMRRSSRRHVFEDIEVKDDKIEVKGQSFEGGGEEAARVSICIPPKNALLLMRCRSDPMKMAALANRFSWDAHGAVENEIEDVVGETNLEENEDFEEEDVCGSQEIPDEAEANSDIGGDQRHERNEIQVEELVIIGEETVDELEAEVPKQEIDTNRDSLLEVVVVEEEEEEEEDEDVESNMSSFEALLDQENAENFQDCPVEDHEQVQDSPIGLSSSPSQSDINEDDDVESHESLEQSALETEEEKQPEESSYVEKDATVADEDENQMKLQPVTTHQEDERGEEEEQAPIPPTEPEGADPENQEPETADPENQGPEMDSGETQDSSIEAEAPKEEKESPAVLPDCLLLMMCEPKLSMEVSKETWVCSTDFIRWLPERPRKPPAKATKASGGCDHDQEPVKRRRSTDSKQPKHIVAPPTDGSDQKHLQQPPRSSCSLPAAAAASMATMIEQKLVNAVGYEPFVLTRCKSEPMRTAAAKLMPESCFWKNAVRKLEPHRRAPLGVGAAAGVGF